MREGFLLVSGWLLVAASLVVMVLAVMAGRWEIVVAMALCAACVGGQVAEL